MRILTIALMFFSTTNVLAAGPEVLAMRTDVKDYYMCPSDVSQERIFCFCQTRVLTLQVVASGRVSTQQIPGPCGEAIELFPQQNKAQYYKNIDSDPVVASPDQFELDLKEETFSVAFKSSFMTKILQARQADLVREQELQLAAKDFQVTKTKVVNGEFKCQYDPAAQAANCTRSETFSFIGNATEGLDPTYANAYSAGCLVETENGYAVLRDDSGYLKLPGNQRAKGETAQEAAARSARQEVGAEVVVGELHSHFTPMLTNGEHYLFYCQLKEGTAMTQASDSYESRQVLFFNSKTKQSLSEQDWTFPSNREILENLVD